MLSASLEDPGAPQKHGVARQPHNLGFVLAAQLCKTFKPAKRRGGLSFPCTNTKVSLLS